MRPSLLLLLPVCLLSIVAWGQEPPSPTLNINDAAPPLQIRQWVKGTPVQQFQKGQVYVLEYWATWCKPCKAAMPHLSELARQYRDKVTIIGIDVYEKNTPDSKIKAFVDSMAQRMDYSIARQQGYLMESGWFDAAGVSGIPKTFVVDANGKLAWIGHPGELDTVLAQVVKGTWDNKAALAGMNENRRLDFLNGEVYYALLKYKDKAGEPDSVLQTIGEIIEKEPKLRYATQVVTHTFNALLQTDPHKAYAYGKEYLSAPSPDYLMIYGNVRDFAGQQNLPAELYHLAAEAYQLEIDHYAYSLDVPRLYRSMAGMYWRARDKPKAIEATQKAIEALKVKTDQSAVTLTTLEAQLQQYKEVRGF
jgi:thiol-disulfide isomerase/thioredoxin